ncbi:MAG TPA: hypothetical protein VF658_15120 [Pyrinomonadaceae bacterium]|jgi:hypothetical protein
MLICNNCGYAQREDERSCGQCGSDFFTEIHMTEESPPSDLRPAIKKAIKEEIAQKKIAQPHPEPPSIRMRVWAAAMLAILFVGFLLAVLSQILFSNDTRYVFIPPAQVRPKDGDPPKFETASKDVQEVINDEVRKLKPGQILFNPAQEMKVGAPETIEVRIANSLISDLEKGLKGKGASQVEEVKVSAYMGVLLNGTEEFFHITLKNREQKIVADDQYTEWIFNVTPLKQGKPSLYLTPYNVIDTPAGEKTYEHPSFIREINVTTTLTYTILKFFRDNWKEIIGIFIASGLLGLIINLIKKRRARADDPPTWQHPL